ncbi:hypothetical protein SAMN05518871_102437 [Psychrobacillus sp. OK028]|uniref:hypothetical protein n=1 Tax=Psychrobacillus sp. OK028 TaxID=1884359 RepID=UPI000883AF50|nr:hypothetical protein [Psychrobacillus sp. OK028]SDM86894.1 hypothetical protein SAMN05518871_102437 [Psychrobacillus sp. OK028]
MRNSRGFSWPETILSLSITFIIATTILPFLNSMTVQLEDKKRDYHSSLVMYEIAKMYTVENNATGVMQVEKVNYIYKISSENVCIEYEGLRGEQRKCVPIIK